MADTIIAETNNRVLSNLDAIDTTSARISQALATVSLLEGVALNAAQRGGCVELEISSRVLSEALWAVRELLEQARDAVGHVRFAPGA